MLKVSALVKDYATPEGAFRAVKDVSFEVAKGQFYTLLGPSGCGKTTTLRCVAGLEQVSSGTITIGDTVVTDSGRGIHVPSYKRDIGVVFQSYAIWPHMDVFGNVSYPLRIARPKVAQSEIRERTMEALQLVGMAHLARRSATQLSGGQQQRVAFARALVRRPRLLLLDEPLSNLGVQTARTDALRASGTGGPGRDHDALVTPSSEALAMSIRCGDVEGLIAERPPRERLLSGRESFVATRGSRPSARAVVSRMIEDIVALRRGRQILWSRGLRRRGLEYRRRGLSPRDASPGRPGRMCCPPRTIAEFPGRLAANAWSAGRRNSVRSTSPVRIEGHAGQRGLADHRLGCDVPRPARRLRSATESRHRPCCGRRVEFLLGVSDHAGLTTSSFPTSAVVDA